MTLRTLAPRMPPFTCHLFVCCHQRDPASGRGSCDPTGQEALRDQLQAELRRRGLGPLVRANKSGCLDQCECGPTVVIYPQGIWYGRVTADDVPRIVEETVIGGRIIPELVISDTELNARACWKWSAAQAPPPPSGSPGDKTTLG